MLGGWRWCGRGGELWCLRRLRMGGGGRGGRCDVRVGEGCELENEA